MASGVFTAGGGAKAAANSSPINNQQVFQDILTGLKSFQENQVVSPAQRAALDEQIAMRGKINETFAELGKGQRAVIVNKFNTQMKNLAASDQLSGLAGSSLAGVGQIGLEGARQNELGGLENQLINAQSNAIIDLSGDFAGTLGETADQNMGIFGALMSLLRPTVSADQYEQRIQENLTRNVGGGGGGGGGGGKSKSGGGGRKRNKSTPMAPSGQRAPGEYHGPGGYNAAGEPGGGYGPGGDGMGKPKSGKTFNYSPTKPLIKAGKK